MNISQQIKELIDHNNSSTGLVANELGQSHSNLLNKLSRDNLRINELEEIVYALGYTQMEIALRGKKENAIIRDDDVSFVECQEYSVVDTSLFINEKKFQYEASKSTYRDILMEILEPEFQKIFGDTLDAPVPDILIKHTREALSNMIHYVVVNYKDSTKED